MPSPRRWPSLDKATGTRPRRHGPGRPHSAAARRRRRLPRAYAAYCRPTDGLDGITLAPFQILACEGRALALTEPHAWHLASWRSSSGDLITPTRHRVRRTCLRSGARAAAADWWLGLTAAGGEGIVVKPAHLTDGRVQPGLKVRGREYLRIIYGPDYTESLDVLRDRHLGKKRQLAQREHGLGIEALTGSSSTRRCGRYTSRSSPYSRWSPSPSTLASRPPAVPVGTAGTRPSPEVRDPCLNLPFRGKDPHGRHRPLGYLQ